MYYTSISSVLITDNSKKMNLLTINQQTVAEGLMWPKQWQFFNGNQFMI